MLLYIEYYYDPTIAALSTLLILFTIGLVQLTERTVGLSNFM
jgi:putative spermidine/putrescine transport system permease protein